MAGILGPVVVNYIREFQLARGVPAHQVYDTTLYILAALLAGGFLCNLLVRPVADRFFMTDEELAKERALAHEVAQREQLQAGAHAGGARPGSGRAGLDRGGDPAALGHLDDDRQVAAAVQMSLWIFCLRHTSR